ncbi:MAG: acetyl-CoA carboxylase carboxyl transferase subunit alpha, partial [Campylobacteraceae bacterium]|nr:acetyl-CoA carboxylase carboxyl transferase subunit alpha [Campylobacteraceae bacterium]
MATYLDFEKSIKSLDDDISNAKIKGDIPAVEILRKNLKKEISKIYKNLNDYQKLQLARHPDRPYTMDYVRLILDDAYQIHGDRAFRDDKAILAYLGYIGGQKVILIGQ